MTKSTDQRDQFNFNIPSYRSYRVDQASKIHQLFRSLLKSISDKNIINDHEINELRSIQNTVEASIRLALILQAKVFYFHRQLTESTRVEEKLNLLSAELVILSTLNLVTQYSMSSFHYKHQVLLFNREKYMRKNDRRLSIRLPSSLLHEIEAACNDQNEPLSRFVKRALIEYLDYHFQEIAPRLQHVTKTSSVIDSRNDP